MIVVIEFCLGNIRVVYYVLIVYEINGVVVVMDVLSLEYGYEFFGDFGVFI